jgi:hypothetical protein
VKRDTHTPLDEFQARTFDEAKSKLERYALQCVLFPLLPLLVSVYAIMSQLDDTHRQMIVALPLLAWLGHSIFVESQLRKMRNPPDEEEIVAV